MGRPLRGGRRPDACGAHVPAGPAARVRRVAAARRAARTSPGSPRTPRAAPRGPRRAAARPDPPRRHARRRGRRRAARPGGDRLAAHGIKVEWPADLVRGLGAGTITRPRSADGAFSLGGVTDLAWQLALDGEPLSEAEADAVAAADGVARLRGRWVLIDPDIARRARERHLGELTGAQALGAALTGQITVDGQDVACAGAGRLAGLVAALRDAGNDSSDPVDVPGGLRAALRGYQHRALRWLARTAPCSATPAGWRKSPGAS